MKNIAFFGVRRGRFPRRCPLKQRQHDDKHIRGARHFRAPLSGCFGLCLCRLSMLQGLASTTVRFTSRAYPRPINVLLPLVSGGYAPAAPSVRRYAQTPPGGQGPGGGGGFPAFKFPMQQQQAKGDALKEFVRALFRFF